MTTTSLSSPIAEFVVGTTWPAVPTAVSAAVHRGITDTLGVAIAGTDSDAFRIIDSFVAFSGYGAGSRVLGSGTAAAPPDAAMANGVACHSLDFDDDDPLFSVGHPSGPVIAALAALAFSRPLGGRRFAEAYLVGIEVTMRLGAIMNPRHFDQGWHATATLGALGSAAAIAKVLDLDANAVNAALGIAASSASGIRANFGTMTKPLHVGLAARNGLVAADLASRGFTSNPEWLGHQSGYVRTFSGQPERAAVELERLGTDWAILDPGLSVKRYPSCSNTHTAIDALRSIRDEVPFDAEDIKRIVCDASPGTETILIYARPTTGLQGKFSMEHCLAVAALRGEVTIEDFTDRRVREVAAYARRIELRIDPMIERSAYGVSTATRVTVELRDGRSFSSTVNAPRGSRSNPMSAGELQDKFLQCTRRLFQPNEAVDVYERLNHLADFPAALEALAPLCAGTLATS